MPSTKASTNAAVCDLLNGSWVWSASVKARAVLRVVT